MLACLPTDTLSRNLQNSRLSRQYQLRLFQAGQLLFQFCLSTSRDPVVLVSNAKLANEFLIAFIQHLFQTRRPLWIATHAVLAVQTVNRSFRGCLRPAWDSIQSWKLGTPVLSRTPLPFALMRGLFYFSLMQATLFDKTSSGMWFAFAVCMRFGFYALLRPRELYSIKRRHLKLPGPKVLGSCFVAVATILDPKNRAFMGRLQVRMVRDVNTVLWLCWYCADLAPDDRLWPFSEYCFQRCLKEGCAFFGLEHVRFTPASLRAGGATHMLESGVSLSSIKFAGSWASEKAMSCYLQEAEAAATLLSMSSSSVDKLEYALTNLQFFERPPTASSSGSHGPTKSF